MRYKTVPCEIDAIQFINNNFAECEAFIGKENYDNTLNYPNIKTLEGTMAVSVGDYIIKGLIGEFYPCKPEVFNKKYELIETNIGDGPL